MSFIYLASPYTSGDSSIMEERAVLAAKFTADSLRDGHHIYSPIVHCHELAKHHELPKDFTFWRNYNFAMLSKASALWVLTLDGWDVSIGVLEEIELATKLSIPMKRKYPC
jgi:hypothetical protein